MKKITLLSFFYFSVLIFSIPVFAQDTFIKDLMIKSGKFEEILSKPDVYEVQIIYTQINRDRKNRPKFKTYTYQLDNNRYFYPASTVKFPSVLLALEKINQLKINGLTKNSKMITGAEFEKHTGVSIDSTSSNFEPSVAQYAKKILLVSDNDAYNRLYEFVGQDEFNNKLREKGFNHSRIFHRLEVGMNLEQNRRTNPIQFYNEGKQIYSQPMVISSGKYVSDSPILKGKGYYKRDSLINKPFDFKDKNFFPLVDQQNILKSILFPEAVKPKSRFDLLPEDYAFVYKYMSEYPVESKFPKYDSTEFYQSYCKFWMFGDVKTPVPKNIRIFNKVGDAYGYLLDNAYIVDFENKVEFMLSAVIACNSDGIFNDDNYDYENVGFPFFANFGKEIYKYELGRKKKNIPNLSKFKINYDN